MGVKRKLTEDPLDSVYDLKVPDSSSEDETPAEPDLRAWGKSKTRFYGGSSGVKANDNFKDDEEDIDPDEEEEKEARVIQAQQLEAMDEEDFLDSFDKSFKNVEDSDSETDQKVLRKLDKSSKKALLLDSSPELLGIIKELGTKMEEARAMDIKLGSVGDKNEKRLYKIKHQLTLNYCINLSAYLLLKTSKSSVQSRSVCKDIVKYKQLLKSLDSFGDPSVEVIVSRKPIVMDRTKSFVLNDDDDDEEEEEDTRRSVNYQITKNKGLTPKRNKLQRNPRVKHREKFRKATIARKGQVRTIRNQNNKYIGEISGINARVKKGIKIT